MQFSEYSGFTETMRALHNMKLVRKGEKILAVNISVDFDRSKHLSDANIKRRKIIRDRCVAKEIAKETEEKKKIQAEEEKRERERFDKHKSQIILPTHFYKKSVRIK